MARLENTDRVSVSDLKNRLAVRDPQWTGIDLVPELRALGIEPQQSMRFGANERTNGYYLHQLDPKTGTQS